MYTYIWTHMCVYIYYDIYVYIIGHLHICTHTHTMPLTSENFCKGDTNQLRSLEQNFVGEIVIFAPCTL